MLELFSNNQLCLLLIGGICFATSLAFHVYKQETHALYFLVTAAFALFSFAAFLDPFLNLWDERFHALVAKNMLEHPLQPTLYADPVVQMAYDRWDRAIVWLHKQPLFLWQIALSFKLFGVSEFTLRLPSIALLSVSVYAIYRSGKLLVNGQVGFLASTLFISSFYIQELISGRQQLDVNDAAFLGYITLSIWSLLEYLNSKNKRWLILIGLFSGAAILCKWLVGLFVYLIWGIFKLLSKEWQPRQQLEIGASLAVSTIIALPWQIYSHAKYPKAAAEEMAYNSAHFCTAIEGHEGNWWYHFEQMNSIYGSWVLWVILPALVAFWAYSKDKKQSLALILSLIFLYVFFSMAATKMPSFTIVGAPIIFTALAAAIYYPLNKLYQRFNLQTIKNSSFILVVLILVATRVDLQTIERTHFNANGTNEYVEKLSSNRLLFTSLNLPENSVLLNVKGRHYIEAMFYTGLPAYNFIPETAELQRLIKNGKMLYIFKREATLPKIEADLDQITIIDKSVEGWD